jgi:hypothetical protein
MSARRFDRKDSARTTGGKSSLIAYSRSVRITNGKCGEAPKALAGRSSDARHPNSAGSRPMGRDASQNRNRPPLA